jgi:hypothetical protein
MCHSTNASRRASGSRQVSRTLRLGLIWGNSRGGRLSSSERKTKSFHHGSLKYIGKSYKQTVSSLLSGFQARLHNIHGWATQYDANMAMVLRAIDELFDG